MWSSSHAYLWLDGHPRAQSIDLRLARLEPDTNRQSLHHLDVVACGILRRQQTVAGTGSPPEAFHHSAVVASDRIDVHARALADAQVLDLCFAEICGDPDLVGLGEREQLLAGLYPIADVDRLFAPAPVHRGNNGCVA